jgi:hypothetical protein
MNISETVPHGLHQAQQFHRQYGANAILPEIDWQDIFKHSKLQTHKSKHSTRFIKQLCL